MAANAMAKTTPYEKGDGCFWFHSVFFFFYLGHRLRRSPCHRNPPSLFSVLVYSYSICFPFPLISMLPPQRPPYRGIARLLPEPIPMSIPSPGDKKLASAFAACLQEIQCWANLEDGRKPLTADMIHFQNTFPGPSAPNSLDQALLDGWSVASMLAFAFLMGLTMRP
jgi:hypothetical protein